VRILQPGENQAYGFFKQNLQQAAKVSAGDVKYLAINVLKGMQFDESAAGGAANLQAPKPKPPEVVTGLVMHDIA
jgi:hypothetical protein